MKQEERIVELDCITHIYPDMTKVQICGLEFVVNRGERVAILGANGCGKTTLLKHLVGVLDAEGWKRKSLWGGPWERILEDQRKDRRRHAGC